MPMLRMRKRPPILFNSDIEELKFISQRIMVDPKICFGKPTVRGTRIWVGFILRLLASGWSWDEILGEYPSLSRDDITAALLYAAWLTERTDPLELYSKMENKKEFIEEFEGDTRELLKALKDWLDKQGVSWLSSNISVEYYEIGGAFSIIADLPIYEWDVMDVILSRIYQVFVGKPINDSWFEIRLLVSKEELKLESEKYGVKYSLLTDEKLRIEEHPALILDPRPIIPPPSKYYGYIIIIPRPYRSVKEQHSVEE